MKTAMLGTGGHWQTGLGGRLGWAGLPGPQELARLQGPVPKPRDLPRTKKRREPQWGLWTDKITREWWSLKA